MRVLMLKNNLLKFLIVSALSLQAYQAIAQNQQSIGDWKVQSGPNSVEAYTTAGTDTSFGVYCSGDQCLFYLHNSLLCHPGSNSPVLISGVNSTASVNLQCANVNGALFEILEPFSVVLNMIKSDGPIGFALPLQNGSFGVSRFSLNGAAVAIRGALERASDSKSKQTPVIPKTVPGTQKRQDIVI